MSYIVEPDVDVPNIKTAIIHLKKSLKVFLVYQCYIHLQVLCSWTVMGFFAVGLKTIYSNKSFNESVIESLLVNLKLFDLVSVTSML